MSKIQDLIAQGKVAACFDFRKNSLQDMSGNGISIADASSVLNWNNGRLGRCLSKHVEDSSTPLNIGNPAELQLSQLTVFALVRMNRKRTGYAGILAKNSSYNMYINGGVFGVFDEGSATWKPSGFIADKFEHCFAVRYDSGVANGTSMFVDGVLKADATVTFTDVTSNQVRFMAGESLGTQAFFGDGYAFMIASEMLTDREIAEVSQELLQNRGALRDDPRGWVTGLPKINDSSLTVRFSGPTQGNRVADLSGNEYNANFSNILNSKGVLGDALLFAGRQTAQIAANTKLLGGNYSIAYSVKKKDVASTDVLLARNGTANYVGIGSTKRSLISYLDGSSAQKTLSGTDAVPVGRWARVGCKLEINGSDVTATHYLDGQPNGTVTYNTGFGAVGSLTTMFGGINTSSNLFNGDIEDFQYYDEVKDDDWFADDYQKYAKHPIYSSDLSTVYPTLANVTAGEIANSGFKASTGTWKVSEADRLVNSDQLLTDGDMEAVDTSAWLPAQNATITKETGSPHGGSQVLKVAYNGSIIPNAYQEILTVGKRYKVRGWARGDGTVAPKMYLGTAGASVWTGTSSTAWQYFSLEHTVPAGENDRFSLAAQATTGGYAEFDDVIVQEIGNDKKWLENVTAGVAYDKQDRAYGTWVLEINKGADGNDLDLLFVADVIGGRGASGQASYCIRNAATERIALTKDAGTDLGYTTTDYTTESGTNYKLAVSRDYSGVFTFYIKGGAYASWTLVDVSGGGGSNPTSADTTNTASKYICADLDAGDRFRMLGVHQGVLGINELEAIY